MKKIIAIFPMMLLSITFSYSCISAFNDDMNAAYTTRANNLAWCAGKAFPRTCEREAEAAFQKEVRDAIAAYEECEGN